MPLDTAGDLYPAPTTDTAPFYEALDDGHLVLQQCTDCRRHRYPVAPVCPYCYAHGHTWQECIGAGTIFSWVRYHRPFISTLEPLVPYVVVTVELDEGPRLFGRLVDDDRTTADPVIGQPVVAAVERAGDGRGVLTFVSARVSA